MFRRPQAFLVLSLLSLLLLLASSKPTTAQTEDVRIYIGAGGIDEDGQSMDGPICGQAGVDGTSRYRIAMGSRLPVGAPMAAALKLELHVTGFVGPDESRVFDVFAIEGRVTPGSEFFEDLGSGLQFGTGIVTRDDRNETIVVELNEHAISYFNSLSRYAYFPDYLTGVFNIGLSIREPFTLPAGDEVFQLAALENRLIVTPVTLPVRSTTWGAIKALYSD